jgi:DNA-binding MarR family transcriptional regulator
VATAISKEDQKDLERLLRVLDVLRGLNPTMPIQLAQTLLLVALNEGASLSDLAQKIDAKNSTISRHLRDLGARNRKLEPGL